MPATSTRRSPRAAGEGEREFRHVVQDAGLERREQVRGGEPLADVEDVRARGARRERLLAHRLEIERLAVVGRHGDDLRPSWRAARRPMAAWLSGLPS
jgi:hypothetical protein